MKPLLSRCFPNKPAENPLLSAELLGESGIQVQLGSQHVCIEAETLSAWGVERETLRAMIRAEGRHDLSRWVYLEHLLEKSFAYLLLKKRDVTGILTDKEHIWLAGRGIDLQDSKAMAKARRITGFRQGMEFGLLRPIQLILYTLLGYQIYETVRSTTKEPFIPAMWDILIHGKAQSIRGALSLVVSNPANAPYLWPLLSFPLIWGGVKAVLYGRRALFRSPDDFQKAIAELRAHPEPLTLTVKGHSVELISSRRRLWWNTLRWLFPLHFIDRQVNYLIEALLFNGRLSEDQRAEAIDALRFFVDGNSGYSRIVGLSAERLLVAGVALKQFDLLDRGLEATALINDEEDDVVLVEGGISRRQELHLREKAQALQLIRRYNRGVKEAWQENGVWGLAHNSYAHYLRWTLGDWDSRHVFVGYMLLKVGKVLLLINLGKNIYGAITDYLRCPLPYEEQGSFSKYVMQRGRTRYTQECFDAVLDAFNKIPGQPACTLVNLLPQIDFELKSGKLDLSNRELTGKQIGELLDGFKRLRPDIIITQLDLSGNQINSKEDFERLMPMLLDIEALWLSNNGIDGDTNDEQKNPAGAYAFGEGLHYLSRLQILDLSKNQLGKHNSIGTKKIGENLRFLTQLRTLNLSGNNIGGIDSEDGIKTIAGSLCFFHQLVSLDISNNGIGGPGTAGMEAIGGCLPYLSQLRILNLSGQLIGEAGTRGMEIFGNSLGYLSKLTTLNLSNNWIGRFGDAGVNAISLSLPNLLELQVLALSENQIRLPTNTSSSLVNSILQLKHLEQLYIQQTKPFPKSQLKILQAYWENPKNQTDLFMLRDVSAVAEFLDDFSPDTTIMEVSGYFSDPDKEVMGAFMGGLTRFNRSLAVLDFSNNNLGISEDGKKSLLVFFDELQHFTQLQQLNLSGNTLCPPAAPSPFSIVFKKSFQSLTQLQHLDLSNDMLWYDGTNLIGECFSYLRQLRTLILSENNAFCASNTSSPSFFRNLQYLPELRSLDLSNNGIISKYFNPVEIREGLQSLTNLRFLDLSGNDFGAETTSDTEMVGQALPHLSQLHLLDLSDNFIGRKGSSGIQSLADGLLHLNQLQRLALQENYFGSTSSDAIPALFSALPDLVCHSLESLNLGVFGHDYISWENDQGLREAGFVYYSQIESACVANTCHGTEVGLPTGISCQSQQEIPADEVCYIFSDSSAAPSIQPLFLYPLLSSAYKESRSAIGSADVFSEVEMPSISSMILPIMMICKAARWISISKSKWSAGLFGSRKPKANLGDLFLKLADLKLTIMEQFAGSKLSKEERSWSKTTLKTLSRYQRMTTFSDHDIETMQSYLEKIERRIQQTSKTPLVPPQHLGCKPGFF